MLLRFLGNSIPPIPDKQLAFWLMNLVKEIQQIRKDLDLLLEKDKTKK
jgi:hypothetical protein